VMGTLTTFAELIAAPQSEKVFLCEAKPAEQVTNFALTAAQTYTYELAYLNETVTLADASTEIVRKAVATLELDGTALTALGSIAAVEAAAGSYWHDTANSLLYIHPTDNGSPNHHTVIVYFWVYFATKGIVLDSRYYEPYIAENGIPSLSQESQEIHWGSSQISSGSVILLNSRGFFDQIAGGGYGTTKTSRFSWAEMRWLMVNILASSPARSCRRFLRNPNLRWKLNQNLSRCCGRSPSIISGRRPGRTWIPRRKASRSPIIGVHIRRPKRLL